MQKLPPQIRDMVILVIKWNAFEYHYEAFLYATVTGTNETYEELG